MVEVLSYKIVHNGISLYTNISKIIVILISSYIQYEEN